MRDITLVFAAWNNPSMCRIQTDYYAKLPEDVRAHLHVIITDDCSDLRPDVAAELPYDYREYRVLKHRRWDWLICRNLGMKEAVTEWRIMTDIDHIVPEETLRYVMTQPLDVRRAYRFSRKTLWDVNDYSSATDYKAHSDSWMMTGEAFDYVGGLDERYSGNYGSSGEFTGRTESKLGKAIQLPVPLWRVGRETVPDASTPKEIDGVPTRKQPKDRAGMIEARRRVMKEGGPPQRLTLPWERIR